MIWQYHTDAPTEHCGVVDGSAPANYCGMALPKPTIRNCPFCRIAMVGSRANPDQREFDTYQCLTCDTVISFDVPSTDSEVPRKRG